MSPTVDQQRAYTMPNQLCAPYEREEGGLYILAEKRPVLRLSRGAKLRPGVRLFPGGHVILLPTQMMAIMELAGMARCRHQCSARVICQVGSDMPEKQAGKQAESLTLLKWKDG